MLIVNTRSSENKNLPYIPFLNNRHEENIKIFPQQPVIFKNTEENQVWMLTSYPPRECGIATFSQDLKTALERSFGTSLQLKIAAIDNGIERSRYSKEVSFIFQSDDAESYRQLAFTINKNNKIKALIIQHEFGLFHHDKRTEFINMLNTVDKPVILVMHTVLPNPPEWMKENVEAMADAADKVIVMTKNSASLLQERFNVPASKISVIPHGTHMIRPASKDALKEKYGLQGKTVLSTFGLISRNKSIETSIKALPAIVKKYPDVVFLVLGRTHPCVVKEEGESYRKELRQLVRENHIEEHVKFINRYLSLEETLEYLQATDIYLFTSKDPVQAVSGTFAYALSTGCAIVSTPIPHAKELLESGCGLLFNFEDPASLSKQILHYLKDPDLRERAGEMALETIAPTSWENVSNQYHTLIKELSKDELETEYRLPQINIRHLKQMTNDIGLIQFARYHQPDISSGYTLDDNARALIAVIMYYCTSNNKECLPLIKRYLLFIKDCLLENGSFLNYRNKDGSFSEQNKTENLEDANGRAMWALGYVISLSDKLPSAYSKFADALFRKALPNARLLQSPRAMSFVLKGLYAYAQIKKSYKRSRLFKTVAKKLLRLYKMNADRSWCWFEPYLTYANSILPEAMLIAYQATGRSIYKQVAKESFDFLLSKTFINGQIKVISNKGWLNKGETSITCFGEQPIDVAYTILALDRFYSVFKDEAYLQKIKNAYHWFLGKNHLGRIIYNPVTGGCYDGLERNGVNLNQGAESTVCHLLARVTAEAYFTLSDLSKKTLKLPVKTVA